MGDVVNLMETARDAVLAEQETHRQACGFRNFVGRSHDPADVRYVLNRAMPNELYGQSIGDIPDHLIAYVLRRVSIARADYEHTGQEKRKDAAVLLSLDLEEEVTRRLTRR